MSTWSSGTGAAGLLGSVSYAGMTSAGLSPSASLLTMLVVPGSMAATYEHLSILSSAFSFCISGLKLTQHIFMCSLQTPEYGLWAFETNIVCTSLKLIE